MVILTGGGSEGSSTGGIGCAGIGAKMASGFGGLVSWSMFGVLFVGSSTFCSSAGASRGSCGRSSPFDGSSALGSSVGALGGSVEESTSFFSSMGASWEGGDESADFGREKCLLGEGFC